MRKASILRDGMFSKCVRCRGSANQRRCVGHHTDHPRSLSQATFQSRQCHPGGNGEEQMFAAEFAADFLEHPGDLVRFDGQKQNPGKAHHFNI